MYIPQAMDDLLDIVTEIQDGTGATRSETHPDYLLTYFPDAILATLKTSGDIDHLFEYDVLAMLDFDSGPDIPYAFDEDLVIKDTSTLLGTTDLCLSDLTDPTAVDFVRICFRDGDDLDRLTFLGRLNNVEAALAEVLAEIEAETCLDDLDDFIEVDEEFVPQDKLVADVHRSDKTDRLYLVVSRIGQDEVTNTATLSMLEIHPLGRQIVQKAA